MAAPSAPARRSGLALQVLAAYRAVLRAARAQPTPPARLAAAAHARARFRAGAAGVARLDIARIEHLLRQAHKAVAAARPGRAGGPSYTMLAAGGGQPEHPQSLALVAGTRRPPAPTAAAPTPAAAAPPAAVPPAEALR